MKLSKFYGLTSLLLIGGIFLVSAHSASAASLSNVFDRITTSRPSAATPLSAASTTGSAAVFNNGSRFLASDSAQIIRTSTDAFIDPAITVSSQSAALTTVYFAGNTGSVAQAGTDVLIVPITAKHTIRFTTVNTIPASGKIVITFPGGTDTSASPSASTFAFNGLTSAQMQIAGATGGTWGFSSPTITYTLGATPVNAGTTVTIVIGCTSALVGNECPAAGNSPRLINPTKSAIAGTADTWRLQISTQDSSSVELDSAKLRIATIDSVFVHAEVEPSLSFTISGVTNGTVINSNNTACTGNTDTTNTGVNATATDVDLGFLSNGVINIAAQDLTVSTNASTGYSITATSSGRFINPATGFWITDANGGNGLTNNDTPAPATFGTSGTPAYGIHPCGARVTTGTWATGATAFSSGAKYSNPWNSGANSYYANIAAYTGGPIDSDKTTVEYAATVAGTTPAGIYRTIHTYVATATF